jgi:hypothetical protein
MPRARDWVSFSTWATTVPSATTREEDMPRELLTLG